MSGIIHHSIFDPNPFGHGGEKRSAQIKNLIDQISFPYSEMEVLLPPISRIKRIPAIFRLSMEDLKYCSDLSGIKRVLNKKITEARIERKVTPQIRGADMIIWESVLPRLSGIPLIAHKADTPIIAVPHNLESLVPSQQSDYSGKESPYWFQEEVQYLSQCAKVYTISREEQWLLNLFGIEADYLPYYPVKVAEQFFLDIRRRRDSGEKAINQKIVLLGSAGNHPTFIGMKSRIELFANAYPNNDFELHVAGFGTERLAPYIKSGNIVLHGAVSNQTLSDLLAQSKVVVIHQQPSSGALTKIPELLIAGVPVLTNNTAARNNYNSPGVYIYENEEEFIECLLQDWPDPPIPEKPVAHELRFLKYIGHLISRGREV